MYSTEQKDRLFETTATARFTVYADFNCPFCYALNERLFSRNLEQEVDFRLIQHLPHANSERVDLEVMGELSAEVAEVRRRAPSIDLSLPMFRPSSAAAVALVYALGLENPLEALQLRRRIYQALWVEGLDISNVDVLAALLLELDIEMPRKENHCSAELHSWQSEWSNNTAFEQNLPVTISDTGETAIGLLLEPELDDFLDSGLIGTGQPSRDLWAPTSRQRILVLENDAKSLRIIGEQMHDAQIEVVEDFIGLIAHARTLGMPDLLLVNHAFLENVSGRDWWRNSTNLDPEVPIPIIHILDLSTAEAKTAAFESGATDIIEKPFHPRLLRSRLNSHLNARRSQQLVQQMSPIDSLTSASNRREFDARLNTEWGRGARAGESLALLTIDIDRLRAYNNSYGHQKGDDCLIAVAGAVGSCLQRSTDWMARLRGGLFAAVLPGIDLDNACKIARDCLRAVDAIGLEHPSSPISQRVSVSIGISAMIPRHDRDSSLILEQAEVALYQAKQDDCAISCFEDNPPCLGHSGTHKTGFVLSD